MFASLKNKIKEETGSDLTNLTPILNNPPLKLYKGRHSRQGSGSSIGSVSDSVTDDGPSSPTSSRRQDMFDVKLSEGRVLTTKEIKRFEKREEEWKRKLQKKDDEWAKRIEKREEEFKKQVEEQQSEWKRSLDLLEKEKSVLEDEKREIVKQKLELEESLKVAEEYKKKVFQYQEDIDQLEGFQTQEMAKIKHLLLVTEQELTQKSEALKESLSQIDTLRGEVNRMHRYEEELSNVQDELESLRHAADRERTRLSSTLAHAEEEARHLRDRVAVLERRASAECTALGAPLSADERVTALLDERALLERRLEEAHLHLADIKSSWSEKIAALETQVGRLSRQAGEEGGERRRAESERDALLERIRALEVLLDKGKASLKLKEEALERMKEEHDLISEELKELKVSTEKKISDLGKKIETSSFEKEDLCTKLQDMEKSVNLSNEENQLLTSNLRKEQEQNHQLESDLQKIREELRNEQSRCIELQQALSHERQDKDAILLRNAQVSQEVQLAQQAAREQQREHTELLSRVTHLEQEIAVRDKDLEKRNIERGELEKKVQELELVQHNKQAAVDMEDKLRKNICDLEEQLSEKNKAVRILQQRLADMKKTLQRELRGPSASSETSVLHHDPADGFHGLSTSGTPTSNIGRSLRAASSTNNLPKGEESDDIKLKYLKHVLIKFLTSREYEAQHLTRAVATLLKFTPEEERLLRETLEWKMSWFGTRPSLGIGQTSKTIPPS